MSPGWAASIAAWRSPPAVTVSVAAEAGATHANTIARQNSTGTNLFNSQLLLLKKMSRLSRGKTTAIAMSSRIWSVLSDVPETNDRLTAETTRPFCRIYTARASGDPAMHVGVNGSVAIENTKAGHDARPSLFPTELRLLRARACRGRPMCRPWADTRVRPYNANLRRTLRN